MFWELSGIIKLIHFMEFYETKVDATIRKPWRNRSNFVEFENILSAFTSLNCYRFCERLKIFMWIFNYLLSTVISDFSSMHKAYVLHQPSKISVQIESIAGYKNIVFLGTRLANLEYFVSSPFYWLLNSRQGHLLQYCFQASPDGRMELQLLQYDKNFSKKPILQLQVLEVSQLF